MGIPLFALVFSLVSFFYGQAQNFQESFYIWNHKSYDGFPKVATFTLRLGAILLIPALWGILLFGLSSKILVNLPTPDDLRNHQSALTTKILDRNGTLLYSIYKEKNRTLIKLSDLPKYFTDATVSIEDKDFYSHKGISIPGIARSISLFVEQGKVQGGSTITQQLVKNTVLSNERTLSRKAREILVALQVERSFSKDQILEMYVNEVSYGGTLYGIEAAAQNYFGVDASKLDIAQATFLAGLPAAPSVYSPYGSNLELGMARQREVLRRMVEDGKISPLQAESAKSEKLVFQPPHTDIKAPHFVMYVQDLLAHSFGEEALSQGGLEVTTTLDYSVQEAAEQIVESQVNSLRPLKVGNGAALITNPKSGEILAMVGSKNFFDTKQDGQVNVTIRPRQPGSSIKPIMYAAAFERGLTPASIVDDSPISFSAPGQVPYAPKNYDSRFHGRVTIRTALAASYNVPAVKTLASIGVANMVEMGRQLGISTWDDSSRFGLSLTLGGGEVLMTDMATAYSTFANIGTTVPLQAILTVKDSHGNVLYQNPCIQTREPCGGHKTLDPRIAYQIVNILSDNEARTPAFGNHSVLTIPGQEVAVKTGTTNGLRDNWTVGFTNDRLAIVWVGNNDNSQMSRVTSGITGASPIWNTLIRLFLDPKSPNHFPIPNDLSTVSLCRNGSSAQCGACQPYTEYFLPGTEPQNTCNVAVATPTPQPIQKRDKILNGANIVSKP
ncbi:MAG TPA: transglycosylase domain-containing protein [Patescibacteria group bacterium]|nr:transglycosylase domain-containing protein [Patescibacteria group bacterium]